MADNKKVYLVKDTLASGLDVEYVKSNLLRIPGIEIVECGRGITPSECMAMVIVPDKDFDIRKDSELYFNRAIHSDIEEFIDNYTGGSPESCIYVFTHRSTDLEREDVETTTPKCFYLDILPEETNVGDWNKYSFIEVDSSFSLGHLLTYVSIDIDRDNNSDVWVKISRHTQLAPEYAMPEKPSAKEMRAKVLKREPSIPVKKALPVRAGRFFCTSNGIRRPLLRKRRGR